MDKTLFVFLIEVGFALLKSLIFSLILTSIFLLIVAQLFQNNLAMTQIEFLLLGLVFVFIGRMLFFLLDAFKALVSWFIYRKKMKASYLDIIRKGNFPRLEWFDEDMSTEDYLSEVAGNLKEDYSPKARFEAATLYGTLDGMKVFAPLNRILWSTTFKQALRSYHNVD